MDGELDAKRNVRDQWSDKEMDRYNEWTNIRTEEWKDGMVKRT